MLSGNSAFRFQRVTGGCISISDTNVHFYNELPFPAPAAALPPNKEPESKQLELENRSDEAKPAADVDADADSFELRRAPESEPPEFEDEEEKPKEVPENREPPAGDVQLVKNASRVACQSVGRHGE